MSAIRMYEAGYASAADIDKGMVLGYGHPMGPLALSDLIGLGTIRAVGISMYEEFKEPLYSPPPLLDRMVDAGLLGKKSGQGSTRTRSRLTRGIRRSRVRATASSPRRRGPLRALRQDQRAKLVIVRASRPHRDIAHDAKAPAT